VVAIEKARSAALFKRPTRAFEDLLSQPGGDRYLKMEGAIPIEGGIPLVMGGKIVGAIGVSGVRARRHPVLAAGRKHPQVTCCNRTFVGFSFDASQGCLVKRNA